MKSIFKKHLCTMIAVTSMISIVGCGSTQTEDNANDSNNKYEISGTVNYATASSWIDESKEQLIDAFTEKYPNITVNIIGYDSDPDTYLSTAIATGESPDILEGWNPLTYPLSTGVVQPLDEFLEDDADIKNVPKNILDMFEIDGKTYGVPIKTVTEGVIVNLDLLESLNLDAPNYDWTMDEFANLLKKSTTDKLSGINSLNTFRTLLMPAFDKNLYFAGYNPETEKFDYTSGAWQKQMSYIMELRDVPGLQANALINQTLRDEGKEDDYQKKFGKDVDAFNEGKQLMKGMGSWDLNSTQPNFNWDFYTAPVEPSVGYRPVMGIDFLFMLNTCEDENKEAAFELMKWMSYGEEGVLKNLEIRETVDNPIPYLYLPVTQTKAIKEKIESISTIPDGLKHFYNNLDKGHPKLQKVIPGYNKVLNQVLNPTIDSIYKGELDFASAASEMEKKANEIMKESWEELRKEMSNFEIYN